MVHLYHISHEMFLIKWEWLYLWKVCLCGGRGGAGWGGVAWHAVGCRGGVKQPGGCLLDTLCRLLKSHLAEVLGEAGWLLLTPNLTPWPSLPPQVNKLDWLVWNVVFLFVLFLVGPSCIVFCTVSAFWATIFSGEGTWSSSSCSSWWVSFASFLHCFRFWADHF